MNVTCPNCATVYRVDPAKVPEAGVRARCAICNAIFGVHRDGVPSTGSAAAPAVSTAAAVSAPASAPAPIRPPAAAAAPPTAAVTPAAPVPAPAEASSAAPAPPAHDSRAANPLPPPRPVSRPVSGSPVPTPPQPPVAPTPPSPRPAGPPRPAAPPAFASLARPAGAAPAESTSPAAPQSAPPAAPATVRPVNPFLSQDPALKARRLARALISDMVVYHPAKRQEGLRDGTLKDLFEEEIKKSWEEYTEQVGRGVAESTPFFREALNEILAGGKQIF